MPTPNFTDDGTEIGGAFTSRKFLITLLVIGLIVGMSLLACWVSGAATILITFIGGVLGALSLYLTGNIVSSHITGGQIITSMANQSAAANVQQITSNKLKVDTTEQTPPVGFTKV